MVRDGLRPPHHEVTPRPEEPPAAASRRMRYRQSQTDARTVVSTREGTEHCSTKRQGAMTSFRANAIMPSFRPLMLWRPTSQATSGTARLPIDTEARTTLVIFCVKD